MSRSGPLRRHPAIVGVLLALALAATASAAPSRTGREVATRPASWAAVDVLATVQGWLSNLRAAAGCILDPNGRCLPADPRAENGCILDPNGGRCLGAAIRPNPPGPTADNGCVIIPDGSCKVQ